MKKICVITGTRAEYGLLYWILKEFNSDKDISLQIIATGMHLSEEFGSTFKVIEEDGFVISKKVNMLLPSDSEKAISKSIGIGMIGFADAYSDLNPDLIVVLGDRFEIFSAVCSALIAKIPVAHIHGGEITEGAFDDALRHSITKMSHLHFTAAEAYKKRVVQLGENPNRVFNVGGIGIDNIIQLKLLSKVKLEKEINFNLGKKSILVTFHPVTLENSTAGFQFQELLYSIINLKNTKVIFTKANADTDGRVINKMIDNFVSLNENSIAFKSMGQLNYLSTMQFVDAVVGNSSSGLLEAPSLNIPTINIGDRQKGRIKANSVISCPPVQEDITNAFQKIYSEDFLNIVSQSNNPYGNGGSSKMIFDVIKNFDLEGVIKKSFYDL